MNGSRISMIDIDGFAIGWAPELKATEQRLTVLRRPCNDGTYRPSLSKGVSEIGDVDDERKW